MRRCNFRYDLANEGIAITAAAAAAVHANNFQLERELVRLDILG